MMQFVIINASSSKPLVVSTIPRCRLFTNKHLGKHPVHMHWTTNQRTHLQCHASVSPLHMRAVFTSHMNLTWCHSGNRPMRDAAPAYAAPRIKLYSEDTLHMDIRLAHTASSSLFGYCGGHPPPVPLRYHIVRALTQLEY
jgi:hypothetical protein